MDETLRPRIKEALVRACGCRTLQREIANDVPLFGEGLGLDSSRRARDRARD